MKERLDVLLVRRGLAESREKAKAVIMAGCVYVNDQKEDKAGAMFDETKISNLEVRGNTLPYVSRGGLKLEKAIEPLREVYARVNPSRRSIFIAQVVYLLTK